MQDHKLKMPSGCATLFIVVYAFFFFFWLAADKWMSTVDITDKWTYNNYTINYESCNPVDITACVFFEYGRSRMFFNTTFNCPADDSNQVSSAAIKFDEGEWIKINESVGVKVNSSQVVMFKGDSFDVEHNVWNRMLASRTMHFTMPIYDHGSGPVCGYTFSVDLMGMQDTVSQWNNMKVDKQVTANTEAAETLKERKAYIKDRTKQFNF